MSRRAERLLLWTLALLIAALCACAALWQYGRAEWKQAYLSSWQTALDGKPTALRSSDLKTPLPAPKRVVAEELGRVAPRWLLLDNQQREGRVGVRAYAIYRAPAGAALLIDFGWVAMSADRSLPPLAPPPLQLDAQGLLVPWPGQGIALAENVWREGDDPLLLTYLDQDEIARQIAAPLAPAVLRLAQDAPLADAFSRDAVALPNTLSPEQHYGYALQWAGFAATVLVIAVVLHVRSFRT